MKLRVNRTNRRVEEEEEEVEFRAGETPTCCGRSDNESLFALAEAIEREYFVLGGGGRGESGAGAGSEDGGGARGGRFRVGDLDLDLDLEGGGSS